MIRKDMRLRIHADPRGKISSGIKVKGHPKSVEWFTVSDFEELVDAYTAEPSELIVIFPTDNIADFFNSEYTLYGSNNRKKRMCDGETCVHFIDEEFDGQKFEAGSESECLCKAGIIEKEKEQCKAYCSFKAFVADPKTKKHLSPNCYYFHSGSKNTADNIYSELVRVHVMTGGRISSLPFKLSVSMIHGTGEKKFPVWNLHCLELRQVAMLIEADKPEQIEEPKGVVDDRVTQPEYDWFRSRIDVHEEKLTDEQKQKLRNIVERGWLSRKTFNGWVELIKKFDTEQFEKEEASQDDLPF